MGMKPNSPKRTYFVVFLIIGCALGCTQLFAPIHEMMHVYVATNNGSQAYVTGWASTSMNPLDRPAIISGWAIQVILFSLMAIFMATISPKSKWATGGFWLGAAVVHWIRAYGSSDFNDTLYRSFANQGLGNFYQAYRSGLFTIWSIMGIALLLVVCIFVFKGIKGIKKAPG